jgi:hypothetical protein
MPNGIPVSEGEMNMPNGIFVSESHPHAHHHQFKFNHSAAGMGPRSIDGDALAEFSL